MGECVHALDPGNYPCPGFRAPRESGFTPYGPQGPGDPMAWEEWMRSWERVSGHGHPGTETVHNEWSFHERPFGTTLT